MKLRAKITEPNMKLIRLGAKPVEYRQIESIILENTNTGDEWEYKVTKIRGMTDELTKKKLAEYEVEYQEGLPGMAILLGDLIKITPQKEAKP